MSDIPVGGGNGPGGIRPGDGLDNVSGVKNSLNFKVVDQGSQTAELIRGQISQMRAAPEIASSSSSDLSFRANVTPSAITQALVAKLGNMSA